MERKPEEMPLWFDQGECKNLGIDALHIMVPEPGDERMEAIGKSVCLNCDVQELCLGWAMKNRRSDAGIYGMKTQEERRKLGNKIKRVEHGRHQS